MTSDLDKREPARGLAQIVFRNTAVSMLGSIVLKGLNFLFSVFVVRRLGGTSMGQYSTVLAFVGVFQIIAELGMSQFVMREIARDRSKTQSLLLNLIGARLALAILSIGVITLAAYLYGYPPKLIIGVALYTTTFLLAAIQAPLQTLLTAYERFDYTWAMYVIGQLAFMVFGAFFLIKGFDFTWLIAAGLVAFLPAIGLGIWGARRNKLITPPLEFSPSTWPSLIRSGLPFGIITLTLTISFSIDTVILSKFQPANIVGWYNVAYNLVFSIMFLSSGFKDAIVPSLSRVYATAPAEVEKWYFRTMKVILMLALPIAVGGVIMAFPLIRFLYTNSYLPSALAFQILVWDVPFLMFASFCGNITTVIRREKAGARIYAISALLNVALNLWAIPRYGLIGASVITVVTDMSAALQFHFFLGRELKLPNMASILGRVVLAAALMGLAVWWLRNSNLFVVVAWGALVYGLLIFGLRLLDSTEWALINKVLKKMSSFLSFVGT